MSNYVHFTPEEKQQAHETNIEELLRREGETLKRSGTELQWGDGSNKVTIRGNTWYHQYEQVGGDAISSSGSMANPFRMQCSSCWGKALVLSGRILKNSIRKHRSKSSLHCLREMRICAEPMHT